jgi:hypothetical protein
MRVPLETIDLICKHIDKNPVREKPEKPAYVFIKHYMFNEKEDSYCHN